jgi:hypothetical protein
MHLPRNITPSPARPPALRRIIQWIGRGEPHARKADRERTFANRFTECMA